MTGIRTTVLLLWLNACRVGLAITVCVVPTFCARAEGPNLEKILQEQQENGESKPFQLHRQKDKSAMDLLMTASGSWDLGFEQEDARAISPFQLGVNPDYDEVYLAVLSLLPNDKVQRFREEHAQNLLAEGKLELAFEFSEVTLTARQRTQIRALAFPKQDLVELERAYGLIELDIIAEPLGAKKFKEVIGEPFIFRLASLKNTPINYGQGLPDAELVRTATSPFVASEIECTIGQMKKISALAKDLKRRKWLVGDNGWGEKHRVRDADEVRDRCHAMMSEILNEQQLKRLSQIMNQRYIIDGQYDYLFEVVLGKKLTSKESDEIYERYTQTYYEQLNYKRLVVSRYFWPKLRRIVGGRKFDAMVGKPSRLGFKFKPYESWSTPVKQLLGGGGRRNPRRDAPRR